jgi:hypothetical protein
MDLDSSVYMWVLAVAFSKAIANFLQEVGKEILVPLLSDPDHDGLIWTASHS